MTIYIRSLKFLIIQRITIIDVNIRVKLLFFVFELILIDGISIKKEFVFIFVFKIICLRIIIRVIKLYISPRIWIWRTISPKSIIYWSKRFLIIYKTNLSPGVRLIIGRFFSRHNRIRNLVILHNSTHWRKW